MQTKQLSFFLSLLLTLCLFHDTQAQQAGRIESMKLLTAEAGWAATRTNLFWTKDDGQHWKDITPKAATAAEVISAVFFLNSSIGWVLFAGGGSDEDQPRFDLASTTDAGGKWTVTRLKIPGTGIAILSGGGSIYFLDSGHGWISLRVLGNTTVHRGGVLTTQDGGASWSWMQNDPGLGGQVFFNTLNDGWTLGQDLTELYVTHDGSKSWRELSLQAPPLAHAGTGEANRYELPTFEDTRHGFLMAAFTDSDRMTVFTTADGGITWKADRVLPHIEESVTVISHSHWMAASIPLHGNSLTLTTIPLANNTSEPTALKTDLSHISGLRSLGGDSDYFGFSDEIHGWLLAGELLSTSDGGATWTDVTPPRARPATNPVEATSRSALPDATGLQKQRTRSADGAQAAPPAAIGSVEASMGFDRGYVLCTAPPNCSVQQSLNYMAMWNNSGPYLATSLYLPSSNHNTDRYLTQQWVTGVLGQGWGLIPIWVGKQSPCACLYGVGTYPGCTLYKDLISDVAATAMMQGSTDAIAAEKAAVKLGAPTAILYKDFENYNPSSVLTTNGANCGSVVNAYLAGWDSQLHTDGYSAGAYGNPTPIANWSANVSPLPDDVWIAQANNQIAIWNQGVKYGMTDAMWPALQRIHQYTGTHNEAWGGTLPFGIDGDIVDAEILSNIGTTNYTYAASEIACTNLGAVATVPYAINDMSNGTLITGPGQTGTIVGYWADTSQAIHGFQMSGGTCSSIDIAGASSTFATGINNLGQVVGFWYAPQGGTSGFLQNPGKQPQVIVYPGAFFTDFYGINDAGQIVGVAYDETFAVIQDFLYYGGTFYPVGTDSPIATRAFGINGNATIAGNYANSQNFEEALQPPTWTGTITSTPISINGAVVAINANDELAGWGYSDPVCTEVGGCGFMWPGSAVINVFQFSGASLTEAYGINDFGQVVGFYESGNADYAILWSPQ